MNTDDGVPYKEKFPSPDHLPDATAILNVKLMTFSNEFKQLSNEL